MIKVLCVINKSVGGCVYYRQTSPHTELHQRHKDFRITFTDAVQPFSDKELSEYKILQYHKGMVSLEQVMRCKKLGLKTIVDFDDYWFLPKSHGLYNQYYYEIEIVNNREKVKTDENGRPIKRQYTMSDFFIEMLKTFDYVTVTTLFLANLVKPYNKNVAIFENSIDENAPIWKIKRNGYNKIRFGWIGGTMHWHDIQLLRGVPNRLYHDSKLKGKYEFRLFGYKRDSIFVNFANIFTDYGRSLDACKLFPVRPVLHNEENPSYAQYYNDLDVVLVPLIDDKFNNSKSELKIVEAGFFHKPVIVSNVIPYKYIINNKNALIVRNPKDWYKHIKFLINNPDKIQEYGENLYQSVKERYSLKNITKKRAEFYRAIVN